MGGPKVTEKPDAFITVRQAAAHAALAGGYCGMVYGDNMCTLPRGHYGRCGPQAPERSCSVCGVSEDDTAWGSLVDVRVVIADGEEGFADITQLLCDKHLEHMQIGLSDLGFKDHRHGSINYLEDESCSGAHGRMDNCPTPTEYGRVLVQVEGPVGLSERRLRA
jgi:hypothetical protein